MSRYLTRSSRFHLPDWSALTAAVGGGFFDLLRRLSFIAGIRLRRFLLALGLRLVAQANKHRKVVRAEERQPLQLDESEVRRMKKVIERKTQEEVARIKRVVQPAPDAGIEEPADFS